MAQATDWTTTNFTKVDASGWYKVNWTEVINSSWEYTWWIDVPAGSVWNAELWVPKLVTYQETFAFGDMTDGGSTSWTLELSTSIPEWAVFVQSFIDAVTGFAWDTSAVITIWDWTDADRYNTGTPNVFADADHVSAWAVSWTAYHSAAKTPVITVTSATDFGAITAWQATITLMYYQSV